MDKYFKYKNIFSGADSIDDITFLRSKCPKDDLPIVDSVIATKELRSGYGFTSTNNIIEMTSKIKYKNDVEKYIASQINSYNKIEPYQQAVFEKIKSRKPYNVTYLNTIQLEKQCPHCGLSNKANLSTEYVICGVDMNGITAMDFENGCLNDWCFMCGKKLCKNWCKDNLHDPINRRHDGDCCKRHAMKTGRKYPDDYCVCHVMPTMDM